MAKQSWPRRAAGRSDWTIRIPRELHGRFANQLYCPLPDRETLYTILLDKVKKILRGNPLWADKALLLPDQMAERTGDETTAMTPRKVISYLAGRDKLLSGEYQRDRLHVSQAERAEKEATAA